AAPFTPGTVVEVHRPDGIATDVEGNGAAPLVRQHRLRVARVGGPEKGAGPLGNEVWVVVVGDGPAVYLVPAHGARRPGLEPGEGRRTAAVFRVRNCFKNPSGGPCSRSWRVAGSGTRGGSTAACHSGSSAAVLARPTRACSRRPTGSCPGHCRAA